MENIFASLRDVIVPNDCWGPVEDGWKGDWTYFQKGHQINKGRPTSNLQKQKARENALKRNKNQKGSDNRNAKTWLIVYEDGTELVIKSIHDWAQTQGYSKAGIYNLRVNKWKRYKNLIKIQEII